MLSHRVFKYSAMVDMAKHFPNLIMPHYTPSSRVRESEVVLDPRQRPGQVFKPLSVSVFYSVKQNFCEDSVEALLSWLVFPEKLWSLLETWAGNAHAMKLNHLLGRVHQNKLYVSSLCMVKLS